MKKVISLKITGVVLCMLIGGSTALFCQALGDVNNDSAIDIVDALLIAQVYVGLNPAAFYENAADVNCSGGIDIVDALLIAQYYVGLLTSFPCAPAETPTPNLETCSEATISPVPGTFEVLNPGESATIYTSEHFAARWNPGDNVPLTASQAQTGLNALEQIWIKYINDIGFEVPYHDSSVKYKVSVNVSDQGWATGAGTGERDPGMWLHYNAFQDKGVLAHEFTHTLQFATRGMRDSDYVGWSWESHAEWMRHQYFPGEVNCAEMLVNYPHLYYGSTRNRYCNWQFWEYLKDKYCYKVVNDIWAKAKELNESGYRDEDPFTVLARNMNWSQEQLNNEFGEWAMRNATWDYTNGPVYSQSFGSYDNRSGERRSRVTILEELDPGLRRYVVPEYWAPQRWGYNLVKLEPDNPGVNSTITVTFKGVTQNNPAYNSYGSYAYEPSRVPNPDSGWRWGLIARESSGARRYSALMSGPAGEVSFNVKSTDTELWLVVVGAPTAMHRVFWDQMYYTIYRYPWMIQLTGAWPEGYHPDTPNSSGSGSWHSNGGGWVASTAQVASTVYVGPHARVLDNAKVSGNARIEDWAVVSGNAQVRDNAVIGGYARVIAGQVYENARVSALTLVNNSNARIHGSARVAAIMNTIGAFEISGTAQILGDVELQTSLSKGVFYGLVDSSKASDANYGANRTSPMPEVTQSGPFFW